VRKLDPSSPQQMALLHRCFSHNMAAIDLWLAFAVLPKETKQFPQRLAASAWHLASRSRGFSGTNDNQRLMPLHVHQAQLQGLPQVSGTNGYMLDMMNHPMCTAGYNTLEYSQVGVRGMRPQPQLCLLVVVTGASFTNMVDAGGTHVVSQNVLSVHDTRVHEAHECGWCGLPSMQTTEEDSDGDTENHLCKVWVANSATTSLACRAPPPCGRPCWTPRGPIAATPCWTVVRCWRE
jgi:hypothetical protein